MLSRSGGSRHEIKNAEVETAKHDRRSTKEFVDISQQPDCFSQRAAAETIFCMQKG